MTYDIINVNIDKVKAGDTVLCNDGKIRTVCNKDIKRDFMGISLFGDCYKLGINPVKTLINLKF